MLRVTRAEYLSEFRVRLEFSDGFVGVADLSGKLTGPVFQSLNDVNEFRQFTLTGHTLCWRNNADLAPEYLRELASEDVAEPSESGEGRPRGRKSFGWKGEAATGRVARGDLVCLRWAYAG